MTSATAPGSFAEAEIGSQPSCWREAAALARDAQGLLPPAGARVAVVGCGTSFHISRAYASAREAAGQGETDAFPASELPPGRRYDMVLAITRSGTTTEVVEVVEAVSSRTPTTVVTAFPEAVAGLGARVLDLSFAHEEAVVATRFPTSLLALLRTSLGDDVAPAAAEAESLLARPLDIEVERFRQYTFLGRGWCAGIAEEAGLKLREAAGAWAEAYPSMEYRHGPISVAGESTLVWSFGPLPPGLGDDVRATGASLRAEPLDPLADLVQAQRVAVALARHAGRDPDRPRHLTYSVVLGAPPPTAGAAGLR